MPSSLTPLQQVEFFFKIQLFCFKLFFYFQALNGPKVGGFSQVGEHDSEEAAETRRLVLKVARDALAERMGEASAAGGRAGCDVEILEVDNFEQQVGSQKRLLFGPSSLLLMMVAVVAPILFVTTTAVVSHAAASISVAVVANTSAAAPFIVHIADLQSFLKFLLLL